MLASQEWQLHRGVCLINRTFKNCNCLKPLASIAELKFRECLVLWLSIAEWVALSFAMEHWCFTLNGD